MCHFFGYHNAVQSVFLSCDGQITGFDHFLSSFKRSVSVISYDQFFQPPAICVEICCIAGSICISVIISRSISRHVESKTFPAFTFLDRYNAVCVICAKFFRNIGKWCGSLVIFICLFRLCGVNTCRQKQYDQCGNRKYK